MKNSRGGKRPGAGRKTGSATKKTREVANLSAHRGISPLEVMLEAMQYAYDEGGPVMAFNYAKDAAPYMHAKIASIDMTTRDETPAPTVVKVVMVDARKTSDG
jgi:hypothetical protein